MTQTMMLTSIWTETTTETSTATVTATITAISEPTGFSYATPVVAVLYVGTFGLVWASITFLLRTWRPFQGPADGKPEGLLRRQPHQQDLLIEQALERLNAPWQPSESDEDYQQRRDAVARQERVPGLDQTEWQQEVVAEAMPEVQDSQTESEQDPEDRDLDMGGYEYGEHEGEGGYVVAHVPAYIRGQSLNPVPENEALLQFQVPSNPEDEVF